MLFPEITRITYVPLLASAVVIVLAALLRANWLRAPESPLPPGPRPLPFVENALDIPTYKQWLTYAQWGKKYGDIAYASSLGLPMIILNSKDAVHELLEVRSTNYSCRPRLPMLGELVGWVEWAFVFMPYGDRWRKHRKAFNQYFSNVASQKYYPIHVAQTRMSLQRLLETPHQFRHHMRHLASATVVHITYGIAVKDANDKYIKIGEAAMQSPAHAGNFGSFLVDLLPLLMYVPAWLPGAGFKAQARKWREANDKHINIPFNVVTASMEGTGDQLIPSMASGLWQASRASQDPEDERAAREASATAFAGGSDTVCTRRLVSPLFFMAMALYPEVQKKAQAELDAILGRTRLPEFSDRPVLPYIEAVGKEVQRWQPVLPLGVAHRAIEEDTYAGYLIPKGSVIVSNAWGILHDERYYPDPHTFNPDRFLKDGRLDPSVLDPGKYAFGFGRRICPGKQMAENSIFIAIASILACFNIEPVKDETGHPIPIKPEMTSGFLSFPEPFECAVTPRSPGIPALIADAIKHADD